MQSSKVEALLSQSRKLADVLKYAFETPTGIPANNLNIEARTTDGETSSGLAVIGSLVLEWTHLSDLLGDPQYAKLAQKGESFLLNPQPASREPFPGLVGSSISLLNGSFLDSYVTWSGGDDSFYEYLIKMYVYDPTRFGQYKDRWALAADSTIVNLQSHPNTRPELTFLADWDGDAKHFVHTSEHLTCFDGGNFILGGQVLKNQTLIDFGLQLVDGCRDTYHETATHIGPEIFSWNTEANDTVPDGQEAFYKTAGFYIVNGDYVLRPEVIESYYYAYKHTGDQKYRDWAWDAFTHINSTCRTASGFSGISDVNNSTGGTLDDFQESFFFAEVMKYAYLIQAPVR
jgi:mannosyl-oligosaccharide alpha-1,2-mannosidase